MIIKLILNIAAAIIFGYALRFSISLTLNTMKFIVLGLREKAAEVWSDLVVMVAVMWAIFYFITHL